MDIKSISTLTLPQAGVYSAAPKPQNTTPVGQPMQESTNHKTNKNFKKKLPYIAGAIVLAGLGIYFTRGKSSKNVINNENLDKLGENVVARLKKEEERLLEAVIPENPNKLGEKVVDQIKKEETLSEALTPGKIEVPKQKNKTSLKDLMKIDKNDPDIEDAVEVIEDEISENLPSLPENICIGFENNQPVFEKYAHVVEEEVQPAISAFDEAKKSINFLNDEIIAKIVENKKKDAQEVNRIISENTKDGHINFNIMRKVAHDFSTDEANRGADRFHQAADVLEQSYLKEFIKTENGETKGIYNLFDAMKTDTELFSIYTQMPMEEAANRLNYLRHNELINCKAPKDMTPDEFFEKSFEKLVEKFQFKKYNDKFKVDGNFIDVMQKNQNLRKETNAILDSVTGEYGTVDLVKLKSIIANESDAHKAANLMEKALLKNYSRISSVEEFQDAFVSNKTLFDIYKKMPKEQATQRINAFRRFEITPFFKDADESKTLAFFNEAVKKLDA